jgi:hypothetical protein
MRNVHYFPRYSQKENVVTNNTLLLFLRLMDHSRTKFEHFIAKLAGEADLRFAPVWLHIGQQRGTGHSVVDGFIAQESIKIAVETKLDTSFDCQQLKRHLDVFKAEDHKLLVLLCPSTPQLGAQESIFLAAAEKEGVEVLPTSFETIIAVMRDLLTDTDEEMLELVRDFEEFCSISNLLPEENYLIFTPPCGPSHKENIALRIYYCPASRGGRKTAFLGIYANKVVRAIGKISKVVTCEIDLLSRSVVVVGGEPITSEESERILEAARTAPDHGWDIVRGHKFFLCDDWASTNFRKSSPNGIQNRRVFDLRNILSGEPPKTVEAIARALDGKTWE